MGSGLVNEALEITADDLEKWANTVESKFLLGKLIRRLIHATVRSPCFIHFPSDEQTYLPGYDGVVQTEKGSSFVPTGDSVWELSTERDVRGKAARDLKNRSPQRSGLELSRRSDTTFIHVTARVWKESATRDRRKGTKGKADRESIGREEWVRCTTQGDGWKAARILDATDLATWLESAPAVRYWLSPHIPGKMIPSGIWSAERWLEDEVAPRLQQLHPRGNRFPTADDVASLLLAGREHWQKRILEWAEGRPGPLAIRADTRDEGLCFVASSFLKAPQELREELLSRTVVVQADQWRNATSFQTGRTLFLLPIYPEGGGDVPTSSRDHHSLIPLNRFYPNREWDKMVDLGAMPRGSLDQALRELSMPPGEAYRISTDSDGRWPVLKRLLGDYRPPMWTNEAEHPLLIPAFLAGEWTFLWPGDRDCLEMLSGPGNEWRQIESVYQHFLSLPDSPLRCTDEAWGVRSPVDAWQYLGRRLTATGWENFRLCIRSLFSKLGEQVSHVDLSSNVVPSGFLWGQYSTLVQRGLVRSLSIVATSRSSDLLQRSREACNLAVELIRDFIKPAAASWAVFRDVLPYLAEAAPDAFLVAVETSLDALDGFWMAPANSAAGTRAQSGVLAALQHLAWCPDYMDRVVELLAKWLERGVPPASRGLHVDMTLANILRPWLPQTGASESERLVVLDGLLTAHPAIGWSLLLRFLPTSRGDWGTTHGRPERRSYPYPPTEALPGPEEIVRYASSLYDRALQAVGYDPVRWVGLLSNLHVYLDDFPLRILDTLEATLEGTSPTEDHLPLWYALRMALHHQRRFAGKLPPEGCRRLEVLYERLAPGDVITRIAWMFDQSVLMPDGTMLSDYSDPDRLRYVLKEALCWLFRKDDSIAALAALAEIAPFPTMIGLTLSQMPEKAPLERSLLEFRAGGSSWISLMRGYVFGTAHASGALAALVLVKELENSGQAEMALETLLVLKAGDEVYGGPLRLDNSSGSLH